MSRALQGLERLRATQSKFVCGLMQGDLGGACYPFRRPIGVACCRTLMILHPDRRLASTRIDSVVVGCQMLSLHVALPSDPVGLMTCRTTRPQWGGNCGCTCRQAWAALNIEPGKGRIDSRIRPIRSASERSGDFASTMANLG